MKRKIRWQEIDWHIRYHLFSDLMPHTAMEASERFGIPYRKAKASLERLKAGGYITRRSETFWNGMFYARRHWYW